MQVTKEIFGLRETLRGAKRDQRERLATYFDQISSALDEVREALSPGTSTAKACSGLHIHADLIPDAAEASIGAERAQGLRRSLGYAIGVRGLSVQSDEEFSEASGAFAVSPTI